MELFGVTRPAGRGKRKPTRMVPCPDCQEPVVGGSTITSQEFQEKPYPSKWLQNQGPLSRGH